MSDTDGAAPVAAPKPRVKRTPTPPAAPAPAPSPAPAEEPVADVPLFTIETF